MSDIVVVVVEDQDVIRKKIIDGIPYVISYVSPIRVRVSRMAGQKLIAKLIDTLFTRKYYKQVINNYQREIIINKGKKGYLLMSSWGTNQPDISRYKRTLHLTKMYYLIEPVKQINVSRESDRNINLPGLQSEHSS